MTAESGLIIVDKPGGWTSHDVVAKIRGLAGTRRAGHAGTLDPMATGVLVVGVGAATRLLGHLALTTKQYLATVRLGQVTDTDDADGEVLEQRPAADTDRALLQAEAGRLIGEIEQVPPAVSAIKVDGQRAYRLARAGTPAKLAARTVTVGALAIIDIRPQGSLLDVDIEVTCSSGTYIRALARDLGAALRVGGHLTALRRTRVGPYPITAARTLDQLAANLDLIPLAAAAAAAFARRDLTAEQARVVAHGGRLPPAGRGPAGPVAAFGPDGELIALLSEEDELARPLAVFARG